MFLGIDPTTRDTKPSACALLDASGSLVDAVKLNTNDEMLALARRWQPDIVGIDSPLGLPKGMCCLEESCDCESVHPYKGRTAERELLRRGIRLYITTKRSFIKGMVYRSIALAEALQAEGRDVIEVYPFASKVALFGLPIPRKSRSAGRAFLRERVGGLVPGLAESEVRWDHDLYDAVIAAYTAYLFGLGEAEAVGPADERQIVVPLSSLQRGRLA